ncbi:hypothetical protein QJS04_geneDACA019956 [Acorus gramineus]|uniref:MATH domain-containing protein n=1 Tax=Acorus gramineus TaxID=55184 RepID=A0AAV8ZV35_ACOGR|nr:hypothetical protein QJS04_geneDACA019956 [Acorus gramineus]
MEVSSDVSGPAIAAPDHALSFPTLDNTAGKLVQYGLIIISNSLAGPKPADLYGKFTWKIENFSTITKRELRSNAFEVGGYKCFGTRGGLMKNKVMGLDVHQETTEKKRADQDR